jgi:hypothetical protein
MADRIAAISGKPAWFESYYVADAQELKDRRLFVI